MGSRLLLPATGSPIRAGIAHDPGPRRSLEELFDAFEDLVGRTLAAGSKADSAEKLVQDCFRHAMP